MNDFQHFQQYHQNPGNQQNSIAIPCINNRTSLHKVNKIRYIEAHQSMTKIFLINNTSLYSTKPISEFEELLQAYDFFRIHRKHLVNLHLLPKTKFLPKETLTMANGAVLTISRRNKKDFWRLIEGLKERDD